MTKTAVEDNEGVHMHWDGRAKELCIEAAEKPHRSCIEALAVLEKVWRVMEGIGCGGLYACECIHRMYTH